MDARVEDRVVALLEAAGSALTRTQLLDRAGDYLDVADGHTPQEAMAAMLSRLVASGRLARAERPRYGKPPEFVYDIPGRMRLRAIVEAAKKVAEAAEPPAPAAPARSEPIPEPEMESPMPRQKTRRKSADLAEAIRAAVAALAAPTKSSAIARQVKAAHSVVNRALLALEKEGKAMRHCKGRSTLWGRAEPNSIGANPLATVVPSRKSPRVPVDANGCRFAIDSAGALAISAKEAATDLRIEQHDVVALAAFLEVTKPLWEKRA